ncbi:Ppx/GppA phosphatase family protein [Arcticibacterium luteifluviistationis]|uniref:Phosphatase n=1 Tax=Arcticibacterium luteifluviistationis TaxID=1784714 RepID=A0A2Z4G8V1_9BACT|nr:rod shape-determining protein [Arcticibacterium luteifluviistationis]AWV97535.1 phosphatase [Arcticibacterium luteifluviistationis]
MKRAIIDLGTNTFHLLIVDQQNNILFKTSKAAKIGMGGINQGIITEGGIERGVAVLTEFKEKISELEIDDNQIFAFGTSALRSASNQAEVLKAIENATGIKVQVISGDREAELIYKGVSQAVDIKGNNLIVDIGGGSVEFIICNEDGVLWKKSLEIGGQRMMELFMDKDPLPYTSVNKLDDYLREKLLPLANACHQYSPTIMVGSSGSYDTLNNIYYFKKTGEATPIDQVGFDYPMEEFIDIYEKLLTLNRDERMAIPGMIELRVEMIVVAVCLIRYLIQNFGIKTIKISKYAMKEGILKETNAL